MYKVKIPKKSGGYRLIYKPNQSEKRVLRRIIPTLEILQASACPSLIVHGFWPGRSPVSNAWQHIGYRYTLSLDLSDFFDSVVVRHLEERYWVLCEKEFCACDTAIIWLQRLKRGVMEVRLCSSALSLLFVDGAARQGLPTSPLVANIAAADMDHELLRLRRQCGWFVYTRYADDLTFSTNSTSTMDFLGRAVAEVTQKHGFRVNHRKTRSQCADGGWRIVTGVAVGERGIKAPRRLLRRLRAAEHQNHLPEAHGLASWAAMCLPSGYQQEVSRNREEFSSRPVPELW